MIEPISEKRREQLRLAGRLWNQRHPLEAKAKKVAYRLANPDKVKEASKIQNKKRRDLYPEKCQLASKAWRELNKDLIAHKNAIRRQSQKSQTPSWDAEFTEFVFKEARTLAKTREILFGFKWHVDHIVPLKGKTVSGFHVWNNLQVIPASVNSKKHNLMEGDFSWQ